MNYVKTREIAKLVKYLLIKCEAPSSFPSSHVKKARRGGIQLRISLQRNGDVRIPELSEQ